MNDRDEWLEADGLGGFASGTAAGLRTRRYHALLLAATTPPTGRTALVNGVEAWLEEGGRKTPLSTQRYLPDVTAPEIESAFTDEPWPTWTTGTARHELFVPRGLPAVVLSWSGPPGATLCVRPLLSGRDFHALHRENPAFDFRADVEGGRVLWRPYPGLPGIAAIGNGRYQHAPDWYRRFQYDRERERGLDFAEDLASPGIFRFELGRGEAWLAFVVGGTGLPELAELRRRERARRGDRLARSVDSYLVRRGQGTTIIAGYPWFADWGRDTFIGLRGLCLATGRLEEARAILLEWCRHVSEGMLPNRFPDRGEKPEYNSVDASLWFVIAVHETLAAARVPTPEQERLLGAADAILTGYAAGTRWGIRADGDGLLSCGTPATNLSWMDARFEGRAVTPRAGKPVEVQALWLNALRLQRDRSPRFRDLLEAGERSFTERFWNARQGCLFDVVDCDGRPGSTDAALRPNQIFAVGGLPHALLGGERARAIVDRVERRLWTPLGLRSLDPADVAYHGRYEGSLAARDEAYHQGTVWTWLAGPFVEAWLRVRGNDAAAREEARDRFLKPLDPRLGRGGLGHLPEIAEGDAPHAPRGCPFQAWSLGEWLRLRERLSVDAPAAFD